MNYYEEKQARKLERYTELADKARKESNAAYERSNKLSEMIPFGQPILVGHHSEGMHRNHIKKIHSAMDKSIELSDKSEYFNSKANNILNSNVISSDDPEALEKLENKLKLLLEKREEIKAREHHSWELSNLSGNITTVKKRILYLQSLKKVDATTKEINGVKIAINTEANRVQMFFPGKPSEEIRSKLKSNGFRWSPYEGAWQRQMSRWSIDLANEIAGVYA